MAEPIAGTNEELHEVQRPMRRREDKKLLRLIEACEIALGWSLNGCPDPKCNVCKHQAEERQKVKDAILFAKEP